LKKSLRFVLKKRKMDQLPSVPVLNLPPASLKFRFTDGKYMVFDLFRKKYVVLTPEEWVRQNFLWWLVSSKGYPRGLMAVEAPLLYNTLKKRADAIVYDQSGNAILIIEFKAPSVKITQDVFDQVARYNFSAAVDYLIVTNGLEHFCCRRLQKGLSWTFLQTIPDYNDLFVTGENAML
jgi:hypothetical protein